MSGPGEGLRIRCARSAYEAFEVAFLIEERREGRRVATGAVTMNSVEPGRRADTFTLPEGACQQLADDLWDAGFRPRGAAGSAGQLDAVQAHLGDMRTLAEKLGVVLEGRLAAKDAQELPLAATVDRLSAEILKLEDERREHGAELARARSAEGMQRARADRLERSMSEVVKSYEAEVERLREVLMAAREKVLAGEAPVDVANFLVASREPR